MIRLLNLLPEDSAHRSQSCGEIVKRAYEFKEEYLVKHPDKLSDSLGVLFRDLTDTRFWGVLGTLDGYYNHSNPDSAEKMQSARVWARDSFSEHELEKLLNICVNQALLIPLVTGWPGSSRGHNILYQALVEKPDSLFTGVVDVEFRKRLNNGRFWEMLPDLSPGLNNGVAYHIVSDVLDENFGDISTAFAPKGLELYGRNLCVRPHLCWLSDKTIDNYVSFVKLLDAEKEKVGISENVVAELLITYIVEVITLQGFNDEDPGLPRFEEFKDGSKSYKERLKDSFVAKYVGSNDVVRNALAKDLSDKFGWANHDDFALSVIEVIPDPLEFLSRISVWTDETKLRRDFLERIRKQYSLHAQP